MAAMEEVASAPPAAEAEATPTPTASANPTALCVTSAGSFTIELFVDTMPVTASNWLNLAMTGFYDGVHFHRVIPNFMAQFGCPNARDMSGALGRPGTGGPAPNTTFPNLATGEVLTRVEGRGGKGVIPDEHTAKLTNAPGTLSMANAGPNSGGSQFFINVKDNSRLDWFSPGPSQHPVFGEIIDGYGVVIAITAAPTGAAGRDVPNTPIVMQSITVTGVN